ncbi:MAG: glycosyltransferase family 39 protein [Deltaproteobacteria bacterium]|nr:glycosyltransferase family 39 protein [Deltaproteobacteria bacterium]
MKVSDAIVGRAGRHASRTQRWLITIALALGTITWLLCTEGAQGIGRDEAQYMRAGEHYWGWFAELADNFEAGHTGASFAPATIDRYWTDNAPDHPVIMKVLFGVSWRLFHAAEDPNGAGLHPVPPGQPKGTFPLFKRPSTAFRLPAILFAGLLAALVFCFACEFVPLVAAVGASVLTIAQPHYFFHAPIACFDAPITTMAVAVGYAYWRSLRNPGWALAGGVLFGLALGIKHNAWLMPFFLVAHYLWMRRKDILRLRLPPVPLVFVSMLVLGPPLFFAHWPWLWPSPAQRARTYVLRHLQHEHYNFEYLGHNWNNPPTDLDLQLLRSTFPFVSTALTMPVTTMLVAGFGAAVLLRRRKRQTEGAGDDMAGQRLTLDPEVIPQPHEASWLRPGQDVDRALGGFFFFQILGPMSVLAVPASPIFGGVKHYMTAYPYVAIVAAIGLVWLYDRMALIARARGWPRLVPLAPAGVVLVCCLPALAETQRSHPDGLSHYNWLAGGFAGGASLGMNRQFWGYSVLPKLAWMAEHRPANRNTYWHDVLGDSLNMYVRDGRLPPGMGNTGVGEEAIMRSDLGIIVHERHMNLYEGVFWESYGTATPVFVRTREGVPLVTGYRRPGAP